MNTKCIKCDAPQIFIEGQNCIYCDTNLQKIDVNESEVTEFIKMKYEFEIGNYNKVIKLADQYLDKNSKSLPCWGYKISSEFLNRKKSIESDYYDDNIEIVEDDSFDFKRLEKSIRILDKLLLIKDDKKFIIEKFLKNSIGIFFQKFNRINYENAYSEILKFRMFALQIFSKDLIDWIDFELNSTKDKEYGDLDPQFKNAALYLFKYKFITKELIREHFNVGYLRSGIIYDELFMELGMNYDGRLEDEDESEFMSKLNGLGFEEFTGFDSSNNRNSNSIDDRENKGWLRRILGW